MAVEGAIAAGVCVGAVSIGTGIAIGVKKYVRYKFNEKPYTAYSKPDFLSNHQAENDANFNFQVIGACCKGKSTIIRQLLEMSPFEENRNQELPDTGPWAITRKPTPYKFKIDDNLGTIFLWDMPGLGGMLVCSILKPIGHILGRIILKQSKYSFFLRKTHLFRFRDVG